MSTPGQQQQEQEQEQQPATTTSNDVAKISWTTLRIDEKKKDEQQGDVVVQDGKSIQVSNSSVVLPSGLDVFPEFVTEQEVRDLMEQVDKGTYILEGFERRRRVQRFMVGKNNDDTNDNDRSKAMVLPSILQKLIDRFIEQTGYIPQHVSVEEYPENQLPRYLDTSKGTVSTFESATLCQYCCATSDGPPKSDSDSNSCCGCFVAQVALRVPMIEFLNRPEVRRADCWNLHSVNHWTGLLMKERSLLIKSKECLWEWRTRIAAVARPPPSFVTVVADEKEEEDRILLLKFSSLPAGSQHSNGTNSGGIHGDSVFGYVPNNNINSNNNNPEHEQQQFPRSVEMPPLKDILTVVITTSPIKSHPSTELLERTFETFFRGGPEFAYQCRKVIICDGCRTRDENTTKKHVNDKQAMRNGIVSPAQGDAYMEFKQRLRQLCASAAASSNEKSPFSNSVVEELEERMGYGYALRHGLRHCVTTPFVIVIQHDRTFMRPTPILETVRTMWRYPNIKYVGMSMRSNLLYRDHFLGKYGRTFMDEMSQAVLRPPELALDAKLYGPDSYSTTQMEYGNSNKLRDNIQAMVETYRGSQQNVDHQDWLASSQCTVEPGTCQLSLTPTFFWYDNTHICETAHYRDFIFNPNYKMVARGGFIEDKVSPVIKKTVERFGLKEGHSRFGCFLLDDHSGMFFTGHLDGGAYMTLDEKRAIADKVQQRKMNAKR